MEISKTQIDRLGDRLKKDPVSEADLTMLDEYRRSFNNVYESVVFTIREQLRLEPTGRPAKSTSSIIEKLLRESIRLSQIQDIAGCRIIAKNPEDQEETTKKLQTLFSNSTLIDRRNHPSNGYRAIHIVVRFKNKLIEIRIRTPLQHIWAEFSEKLSDVIDTKIKYGKGPKEFQDLLSHASKALATCEEAEKEISTIERQQLDKKAISELNAKKIEIETIKQDIVSGIDEFISHLKMGREI
jgi:putative GTP pyrophosphokinase